MLDPFGGVALGAADALRQGVNWIGVELEQRFVDTGAGCDCEGISKGDWIRFYGRWDKVNYKGGRYWCPRCVAEAGKVAEPLPQPSLFEMKNESASYVRDSGRIPSTRTHRYEGNLDLFARTAKDGARAVLLQGDSRRLADVLGGAFGGIVTSPPWGDIEGAKAARKFADPGMSAELFQKSNRPGTTKEAILRGMAKENKTVYGETEDNLGNLTARVGDFKAVIASPPFAGTSGGRGEASRNGIDAALFERHQGSMVGGIGDEAGGNMASMQAKEDDLLAVTGMHGGKGAEELGGKGVGGQLEGVITSPPYASSLASDEAQKRGGLFRDPKRGKDKTLTATYGETEGQLGLDSGDTFWGAAKLIVSQCRQVLAADGVAVFITKNFVKGGQRVPFTDQWVQLCEACGFELIVHARAWLIEDRQGQSDFDGIVVTKRVQHKSFFRLLAEKNGSPSIDWEDVLIFRIAKNYGKTKDILGQE